MATSWLSGQPVPVSEHPCSRKKGLLCLGRFSCVSHCARCLSCRHRTPLRGAQLHLLSCPRRHNVHRMPLRLPPSGSATPALSACLRTRGALSPSSSSGPLAGLAHTCCRRWLGSLELTQHWAVPEGAELREGSSPQLLARLLRTQPTGALLARVQLGVLPAPSGPCLPQGCQPLGPSVPGQGLRAQGQGAAWLLQGKGQGQRCGAAGASGKGRKG